MGGPAPAGSMSAPAPAARPRRLRVLRILAVWLTTAVALAIFASLLPGVTLDSSGALAAAALIALVNSFVWPVLIRFALPFTVLTLGLGAVVLNGLIIFGIGQVVDGFHVDTVGQGILLAIGLAAVSTLLSAALAIDDEDLYARNVVRRAAKHAPPPENVGVPGIFFLEIDGLAHDVLARAMRDGNAPTMARWVREGSHRLWRWETDWSSQTGACQAGLLHGSNHDMPAFRWWEKDRGAAMVTNHPKDAAEIERRHSDGKGLLHLDGASRANIVSGDAPHSLLTMSTVLNRERHGRLGQDYFAYFARPYNVFRTVLLALGEMASELWSARRARRLDIQPSVPRGLVYALMRAWATVLQRDLQMAALVGDLYSGRPVAYSTFLGYDEVARHSGIERPETLMVLRRIDRLFERLARVAADAPRDYRLVVLSDHGQSQGATFLDRYGLTLEALVEQLTATGAEAPGTGKRSHDEALGFVAASLTEASGGDGAGARVLRSATKRKKVDGEVRLGEGEGGRRAELPAPADGVPEIVAMASGCLGLVSFPREPGRVTREWLDAHHPGLLAGLRAHEGIGFVLVRTESEGSVVLGPRGTRWLDGGRVEGEDPLAPFGPRAAEHVRRTDSFPHCADLMINSTYWPSDEVAAFEELVGSHGGMGGTQSYPFVLAPAEFSLPDDEVVGAEHMHRHLRRWLAELGHSAYAPPAGLDEGSAPSAEPAG
jgi:uncharacterized membrane protein YvlD (DUF360 family)